MTLRLTLLGLLILVAPALTFAWTGPSATAPNSNASAPINVGAVDQVKSANIGVNGIAVFGNSLLGGAAGSNAYLNFGATAGSSGYGIRDNAGALEFKNSGGSWQTLQSIIAGLGGSWTTSGSNIYNANSGNVGIGTASPTQKLHVADGRILVNGSSYVANPSGPVFGQYNSTTGYAQAPAGGKFEIWDDATVAIATFADSGNVGIRMSSPANTLHVSGTIGATSWIGAGCETSCDNNSQYNIMYADGSFVNRGSGGWAIDSRGVYGVYGEATGGQAIRGYSGSNWGGYFQGAYGLHAQNHSGYYAQLGTSVYGLSTNGAINVTSAPAGYWAADIRSSGSHGIHTSNAEGYWSYVAYSSYGILTNGNIYGAAFYYYSDERLKKNVATITGSLKKVLGMRGVSYELIDQSTDISKGTQLGLIAQEVEKVAPEVVRTDEKGMKAIDYPRVVPLLVEAIKEQNARIDAQQVEIDELKSAILNLTKAR